MPLKDNVNRLLAFFGVVLVRRASLEKLIASQETSNSPTVPIDLSEIKDLTTSCKASIEARIDEAWLGMLRQQISTKWDVIDYFERMLPKHSNSATCPFCGYIGCDHEFNVFESHCIFGGGRLTRFQCPECDVIFGPNKMLTMTESELTQDYESHYKVYQEGDSTEQEIRAFHLLQPVKNGVYLNYGAGGWSKSIQELRNQGWNVFAFEPHESAVTNSDWLIRSKADLVEMKFDGIFSNNVLEHLRYPVQELSFLKNLLKAGGRMSHATPCFEYLYEYTRFHLFFYLGRSRDLLAKKAGLFVSDFIADGDFMCTLYEVDWR